MTPLRDLECFASMDWGYNAFGCFLWWVCLTDGHYHIVKEWKFQRLTAAEAGKEFKVITKRLGLGRLRYVVADPACWQHHGQGLGESLAETLSRQPIGLPMRKGDNNRRLGWQRLHELFQPAPDGQPWLTVDPSCSYLKRTIPAAMSDKHDPDDVDTNGDDHGIDALRFGAMSRPSATRLSTYRTLPKHSAGSLLREVRERAEGTYASV